METKDIKNQTSQDAYTRLDIARWGSLSDDATDVYLYALEREIRDWLTAVRLEMSTRGLKA